MHALALNDVLGLVKREDEGKRAGREKIEY